MKIFDKFKKTKCDLCDNKISNDPYTLVVESEEENNFMLLVCDECGILLERMREKFSEMVINNTAGPIDESV